MIICKLRPRILGSRRRNWKIREKHFLNPNPEILLYSSYSFWPELSTSGSDWDLASRLPWKNCEKYKKYFFKNYNLNVKEFRDSDLKNAFPGIFNFTVGILIFEDDFWWWLETKDSESFDLTWVEWSRVS